MRIQPLDWSGKTIFQQPFDVNKSKIKNDEEYKIFGSVEKNSTCTMH